MSEEIVYKEFYNEGQNLPEPKWGAPCSFHTTLQCPTCGSTDMYYSAHPDNPEVILEDTVRCKNCGRLANWDKAFNQRVHHPTGTPREVVGKPGFTVIDLLIVVGILGILAAVVVPTLARLLEW